MIVWESLALRREFYRWEEYEKDDHDFIMLSRTYNGLPACGRLIDAWLQAGIAGLSLLFTGLTKLSQPVSSITRKSPLKTPKDGASYYSDCREGAKTRSVDFTIWDRPE